MPAHLELNTKAALNPAADQLFSHRLQLGSIAEVSVRWLPISVPLRLLQTVELYKKAAAMCMALQRPLDRQYYQDPSWLSFSRSGLSGGMVRQLGSYPTKKASQPVRATRIR